MKRCQIANFCPSRFQTYRSPAREPVPEQGSSAYNERTILPFELRYLEARLASPKSSARDVVLALQNRCFRVIGETLIRLIGMGRRRRCGLSEQRGRALAPTRLPDGFHQIAFKTRRCIPDSYSISNTASISTATLKGRDGAPTAKRACLPLSPKISTIRLLAPFTTLG